jgi:hypothetical protein
MKAKVRDPIEEAEINNLLEGKDSMIEGEIQTLLDDWIRARRRVWDTLFGLVNANTPDPLKKIVEQTTGLYEQMVASMLEAQAAALSTTLRAFGPANSLEQAAAAWGEGMRRMVETAAETQSKTGEARSKGPAGQSSTITENEAQAPSKAA